MQPLSDLSTLFDLHARTALGYAFALLQDRAAAEEVVLDALLAVWRAGLAYERNQPAQRLLLVSVVRRGVGTALLARRRSATAAIAMVDDDFGHLLHAAPAAAQRLRAGLDSLHEGVVVANVSGSFVVANTAVQAMYGAAPPPDLTVADYGRFGYRTPDGEPFTPENLPLARSLLRGEIVVGARVLLPSAASGRLEPLVISSSPLLNAHQRIIGALAVCEHAQRADAGSGWLTPPSQPPPTAPGLITRLGTLKGELERLAAVAAGQPAERIPVVWAEPAATGDLPASSTAAGAEQRNRHAV